MWYPMCQKRDRGLLEGCDEILVTLAKQRTIKHLEGNQHVWTFCDRLMTVQPFKNVSDKDYSRSFCLSEIHQSSTRFPSNSFKIKLNLNGSFALEVIASHYFDLKSCDKLA